MADYASRSARGVLVVLFATGVAAQDPHPEQLLPPGAVLSATVDRGADWARGLGAFATPLPEGLAPARRMAVGAGLLAVQAYTGMSLEDLVETLVPGPAVAAVFLRPEGPRMVAVCRPERTPALDRLLAKSDRLPHRWQGDFLVLGQDAGALELVLDEPAPPRADRPDLGDRLHIEVDLAQVRRLGEAEDPWPGIDGGGRFLFGPWVDAFWASARATADVTADAGAIVVRGALDAVPGKLWGGLRAAAGERSLPNPDGLMAWMTFDRSLGNLFGDLDGFLRAGEVVEAKAFLSIADTLLGAGTTFEGFLGMLREPMSALALDAGPEDDTAPRLGLPGFALTVPIDPDAERQLRRIIKQTTGAFVLIANEERRQQQKLGAFGARAFQHGDDAAGVIARLPEWRGVGTPPTEWGLEITVAVGSGHLVLGSTVDTAERVFDALEAGRTRPVRGDSIHVDGAGLARLIERNRSLLALSRMLDEGENAREAGGFWSDVVAVAKELTVSANGTTHGDKSPFEFRLERRR